MNNSAPRSSDRHCVRCGADTHGKAPRQPHLCPDLMRRLERRLRQVEAVRVILVDHGFNADLHARAGDTALAERIVQTLSGMGVADD